MSEHFRHSIGFPAKTLFFVILFISFIKVNFHFLSIISDECMGRLIAFAYRHDSEDVEGFLGQILMAISLTESVIVLMLAVYFIRKYESRA